MNELSPSRSDVFLINWARFPQIYYWTGRLRYIIRILSKLLYAQIPNTNGSPVPRPLNPRLLQVRRPTLYTTKIAHLEVRCNFWSIIRMDISQPFPTGLGFCVLWRCSLIGVAKCRISSVSSQVSISGDSKYISNDIFIQNSGPLQKTDIHNCDSSNWKIFCT